MGRPIAGAGEALAIHERLQQIHPLAILGLPVRSDPSANETENVTGQVGDTNPGKDQKPGIVGDPTQALSSLVAAPANPLITGRTLPGGGSEHHAGQRSTLPAADPILQVLPNPAAVAQVMIAPQTFLQLRTSALSAQLADLLEQEGTHPRE